MNGVLRLDTPARVDLNAIPTNADGGMTKDEARARTEELGRELNDLEDWLFAAKMHSVLAIFQGRDTSGKDGSIRAVLSHLNALSIHVTSFGPPTERELAHDFLWRVHMHAPPLGGLHFFNRSHYEDVLAARVRKLVPEPTWRARFAMINDFERLLSGHGTIIVKFFLHISKDEQKRRLLEREKDPEKAWKLNPEDWAERKRWTGYTRAYEDVFKHCSTASAPWHIIPADYKWFRNLAVMRVLVETLRPHKKAWMSRMTAMARERRAALQQYRAAEDLE